MLAAEYGVSAFCYWRYWFAGGRVCLSVRSTRFWGRERRLSILFWMGKSNLVGDMAWGTQPGPDRANLSELWWRTGLPGQFEAVLPAFTDGRYLR